MKKPSFRRKFLLIAMSFVLCLSGASITYATTYDPDAPLKEPGHLPQTILNKADYKTPPVSTARNAVIYKALFSFDTNYHSEEFLPKPLNTLLDYYKDSKGRLFLKIPKNNGYSTSYQWYYMGSDRYNLARLPMDPRNMTASALDAHVNALEQLLPRPVGNTTLYMDVLAPMASVQPDPILPGTDPNQAPGSLPMSITNAKNYKNPPSYATNNGKIEGIYFNWDTDYHPSFLLPNPLNASLDYYRDYLGRLFIKHPGYLWLYVGSDHYNLCALPLEPYLMKPDVLTAYVNQLEKLLPANVTYGTESAGTSTFPTQFMILPGQPSGISPPIVQSTVIQPPVSPPSLVIPGLAAWFKFDGDLKDASGNGNNGSEVGVVGYTTSGALGQGLNLNGGYVKIPGSTSLNLGEQFTLSAWVKMNTEQVEINNYNTVLYKENIAPDRMDEFHYYTAITGTSDARMELDQRSTGFEAYVGTQGVFPLELHTRWAMVTWVSDGDTLYLYVDGKLNTTGTTGKREYNAPFLDNTTATLYIGGPAVGSLSLFDGQLDEVKLYSRALSGTEIKSDYDAVKGGGSNVIQLWIGQKILISDAVESVIDSAPLILSGRTLVPVRPIIEAMGGNVTYDQGTRRIDLTLKNRTLTLWIDKYEAIVDGQTVALQVAPTVVNGRTMLPLRFAAESLGATLFWEPVAQKITLRYTR